MIDLIRRRLTMAYVGILALILVLVVAVVVLGFWDQVLRQQDELLRQRIEGRQDSLLSGRDGSVLIPASSDSGIALAVVPLDGEAVPPPESPLYLGLPRARLAEEAAYSGLASYETVELPGEDSGVRVASIPVRDEASGGTVAVVQAARSLREPLATLGRLVSVLTLVGVGALALSAAGGLYMSRRAMRPVGDAFDRQRAFIADASHELKTPLTLIRAGAEVLHRGLDDADDRELVEDLLGETDRMNATLTDLLTLARLDAGKLAISREAFDLSTVVSETAERFGARAASDGVKLEVVHRSGKKLPARGDPERAGQVLAALLDNALRFAPPGGTVEVATRAGEKGRVVAIVTDTGPGISPEHLPRVFDRFYRAEAARTRAGGGTGLGLTIARDLARAQGGELAAGNAPESGASFTLELPAG